MRGAEGKSFLGRRNSMDRQPYEKSGLFPLETTSCRVMIVAYHKLPWLAF